MNKNLLFVICVISILCQQTAVAALTWVEDKKMGKIKDIEVDPQGRIWVLNGNVIGEWQPKDSFRGKIVRLFGSNNKIILNDKTGVLRAVIDRKLKVLDPDNLPFLSGIVENIAIGKKGELWAVTKNNNIYQRVGKSWKRFPGKLSNIAFGLNGEIWGLGVAESGKRGFAVLKYDNNQWQDTGARATDNNLAVDAFGKAWIIGLTNNSKDQVGVLRNTEQGWQKLPRILKPRYITQDRAGAIWVGGTESQSKRYPAIYQWQNGSWKMNEEYHVGHRFAFMPDGRLIFPGVYITKSGVASRQLAEDLWQTANLSITNFSINQQGKIWVLRDSRVFNRTPEILTWDGSQFETAITTKRILEVGNKNQDVTDWPKDIAVDKQNTVWILANSQIYSYQNGTWKKADDRYYIDLISSPKGEIFAIENSKKLSTPDPYKKRYIYGRAIYKIEAGKLVNFAKYNGAIFKVAIDNKDVPWILTYDPKNRRQLVVMRLQDERWETMLLPEKVEAVMSLANGMDGTIWLGAKKSADRGIYYWRNGNWEKRYNRVLIDLIGGDASGNVVGISGGGFMSSNPDIIGLNGVKNKQKRAETVVEQKYKKIIKKQVPKQKPIKVQVTPKITTQGLIGCWKWSNGVNVVVANNGLVKNGAVVGKWDNKKSKKNGVYSIQWPSAYDYIKLANNGSRFEGVNIFGMPVSGDRISGKPDSLIGEWMWFTGIKATISKDHQVKGGPYSGKWKKVTNGYAIEWPIIDRIEVSADGKTLTGKNQFGVLSAIKENCKKP